MRWYFENWHDRLLLRVVWVVSGSPRRRWSWPSSCRRWIVNPLPFYDLTLDNCGFFIEVLLWRIWLLKSVDCKTLTNGLVFRLQDANPIPLLMDSLIDSRMRVSSHNAYFGEQFIFRKSEPHPKMRSSESNLFFGNLLQLATNVSPNDHAAIDECKKTQSIVFAWMEFNLMQRGEAKNGITNSSIHGI